MAPEFNYQDLLPLGEDSTQYRLLSTEGVSTFTADGKEFLKVTPQAISDLTQVALHDISHYLRSELSGSFKILANDRFVATC